MFYLYDLLDPTTSGGPLSADVPLISGSGILTGIVPRSRPCDQREQGEFER